jgi:hypothetical protein
MLDGMHGVPNRAFRRRDDADAVQAIPTSVIKAVTDVDRRK